MPKSFAARVGVITAVQFAAAMAIVLWPVSGWAQGLTPSEFKPIIEQKMDARPSPAQVTSEEESALISKGYVKIGTIHASKEVKKKELKKADPDMTKQLESAILQKAAEAGGDVVQLTKVAELETTSVRGVDKCKHGGVRYSPGGTTPGGIGIPPPGYDACPGEHVPTYKDVYSVVTEGTVWRNDPKLIADIAARAAEAARQAADAALRAQAAQDPARAKLLAGDLTVAKALLNEDPSLVASRDQQNGTPLHWAAEYGPKDLAELLLAKGADLNARDNARRTPLHIAARYGHKDVAELLLAHGADANAKDKFLNTPLDLAAYGGYQDVAELLLAHSADVNAKDDSGETPLMSAQHSGNKELVESLLAHGAEVNAKDNNGCTPLCWALFHKRQDFADLLRQHGGHL
jgi:hypothetical protein